MPSLRNGDKIVKANSLALVSVNDIGELDIFVEGLTHIVCVGGQTVRVKTSKAVFKNVQVKVLGTPVCPECEQLPS